LIEGDVDGDGLADLAIRFTDYDPAEGVNIIL
jgi:hypothetical protein